MRKLSHWGPESVAPLHQAQKLSDIQHKLSLKIHHTGILECIPPALLNVIPPRSKCVKGKRDMCTYNVFEISAFQTTCCKCVWSFYSTESTVQHRIRWTLTSLVEKNPKHMTTVNTTKQIKRTFRHYVIMWILDTEVSGLASLHHPSGAPRKHLLARLWQRHGNAWKYSKCLPALVAATHAYPPVSCSLPMSLEC